MPFPTGPRSALLLLSKVLVALAVPLEKEKLTGYYYDCQLAEPTLVISLRKVVLLDIKKTASGSFFSSRRMHLIAQYYLYSDRVCRWTA